MRAATFPLLFGWFTARQMAAQAWRAALVVLGIGLGAAVFGSVRLAVDASLSAFSRSMDILSGTADATVARPGGGLPDELAATLLRAPGVRAASPLVTAWAVSPAAPQRPFRIIGLDPLLDRPFRPWAARQGGGETWSRLLTTPRSLALGAELAKALDAAPGGRVTLDAPGGRADFEVLAVLEADGLGLADGGFIALADIATVQEFAGRLGPEPGSLDRIDLLLTPDADRTAIGRLLPAGAALRPPAEAKDTGQALIRAYRLNLTVLSFVSLFVGMFLVYSLVAVSAASRRRELAILRSLGASRRLVFGLFLAEGAALGFAGWLASLPLTLLMTPLLLKGVSATINTLFVRVAAAQPRMSAAEALISLAVTLGVSVAAALAPAREAQAVPPGEALAMAGGMQDRSVPPGRLALAGALLALAAWPLSLLPGPTGFPLFGYLAIFALFAGCALLSPWLLDIASRCAPLLARLGGQPASLAAGFTAQAGLRAAVAVGALITAVALAVALSTMILSFRTTFLAWVEQTISGDLFIRPLLADESRYQDPMPTAAVDFLRAQADPGMTLLPYRRLHLTYPTPSGRTPYQLEAMDLRLFQQRLGRFLFLRGNPAAAMEKAGSGALISEIFATATGLGVGDRLRDAVAGAALDLEIVGVIRDYRTQGGAVYVDLRGYQAATGDRAWSGVRIFWPDAPDPRAAAARLKTALLARPQLAAGLEISLGPELRQVIVRIFDETFAVTGVLLLIAMAVAALGITTTLAVLVLLRRRELATLAAIGGSAGQIRAMILWEAAILVLAGQLGGLPCGLALSAILIFVINKASFGWTFVYRVDGWAMALCLPLVLAASMLASLPAVRLALAGSPAQALRERL